MKRALLGAAALVLSITTGGLALADGHHGGGWHHGGHSIGLGVVVGVPLYWPDYYYYPYYPYSYPYPYYPYSYYSYPPAAPYAPPYVVPNDTRPPTGEQTPSWYYCPSAKAYYPYVRQCPKGWQRVPPQPPPAP